MTSAVARLSASVSSDGITTRTSGVRRGPEPNPRSDSATLTPSPVFGAPIPTVELMSAPLFVLIVSHAGTIISAANSSGPKTVAMMNHLVRTRSMYSRLMTAQSLPMARHPRLHALGADFLQEDLMQRRLHQLESLYSCSAADDGAQQLLRVGARLELHLKEPVRVVDALDQ